MIKRTVGLFVIVFFVGIMILLNVVFDRIEPDEHVSAITTFDAPRAEIGLKQGNVPPDFELTTLTGDVVKLSDYKGKKVILNFWATWCPPCKEEMPHMEKYYKKNKNLKNVEIIAVNMTTEERLVTVREFINKYELTFPIPLDNKGVVMDAYQILTLPMTYIINTDGTIAHQIMGPLEEKKLEELVNNLE